MSGNFEFSTVGKFYGSELADFDCELMMMERFAGNERAFKKEFKAELRLMQTKWFDYRLLHPVVATYLYAAEFTRIYQRYYAKTRDYEKANYVKGFSGGDAWRHKTSGGFVKGRRQADALGIPYWFYIDRAFEFLYRRCWKNIPRHFHLYTKEIVEFVQIEWAIYSKESLVLAELSFFKGDQNRSRPEWLAHRQWMINRIMRSPVPKLAAESLRDRGYVVDHLA
ncbi:MAG: hypothetical protein IBX56_19775 [Methylomicrobium sp.]|nr:hypothetical protein [Methylomicrobium sp.]